MESATPAYFASPQLSALTGGRSRQDASAHSRHSSPCIITPLMHNGARMHSTHKGTKGTKGKPYQPYQGIVLRAPIHESGGHAMPVVRDSNEDCGSTDSRQ